MLNKSEATVSALMLRFFDGNVDWIQEENVHSVSFGCLCCVMWREGSMQGAGTRGRRMQEAFTGRTAQDEDWACKLPG